MLDRAISADRVRRSHEEQRGDAPRLRWRLPLLVPHWSVSRARFAIHRVPSDPSQSRSLDQAGTAVKSARRSDGRPAVTSFKACRPLESGTRKHRVPETITQLEQVGGTDEQRAAWRFARRIGRGGATSRDMNTWEAQTTRSRAGCRCSTA
jgi:hypothetical protein